MKNLNEVKRYDIGGTPDGGIDVQQSQDGYWVKHEDYAELKAQRDALAAENAAIDNARIDCLYVSDDDYDACPKNIQVIIGNIARLKTPATEARLNAVRAEGAEKVADYHFIRIDALKDVSRQGYLFHKAAYSDAINVVNLLRAGAPKGDTE